MKININYNSYLELEKIAIGAFSPLDSFMSKKDFESVAETMRLSNGLLFPLPILLPITDTEYQDVKLATKAYLFYQNLCVGSIEVSDIYNLSINKYIKKIFGTNDINHPGVIMMLKMGSKFIAGKVKLKEKVKHNNFQSEMSPRETKALIKKNKFLTVAGFQTRNIPHKAHEFIHRLALEQVDGLFIQPIIGEKKKGDFTSEAVIKSYDYLINNYLPKERIMFSGLSTSMRYAGPREAVFHALIRKNYGCTHFIVGRDHAGVSNYYKIYEAQDLSKKMEAELGIKILDMKGPFYCNLCEGIVTENTCPHKQLSGSHIEEVSGTKIRSMLRGKSKIDKKFLRPDLFKKLKNLNLFIG